MLFDWNLSRHPFLWEVFDLDWLRCTGFEFEHLDLFLCPMFTQRPMNDQKTEQSNEHCQQILAKLSATCQQRSDGFCLSCSLAVSSQENPLHEGVRIIDAILAYISFMCVEECRCVYNFKSRSWQSHRDWLYVAVWTESEFATRWPAAASSTEDIFLACWMVVM